MDWKIINPSGYHEALDWKALRDKFRSSGGRLYWRSLEELSGSPQFQELLHREFPRGEPAWSDPISRRGFFKLMAASLALAGLAGCSSKPRETILPYSRAPEDIVPGNPLYFATAMTLAGSAMGLLVETHEGRPTKIEGNPRHPASLGSTDTFRQASILGLYDPDRAAAVTYLGDIRPWQSMLGQIQVSLSQQRPRGGAGLRLLTDTVVSPTLASQIRELLQQLPQARWHQYEPCARDAARQGSQMVFGRPVNTIYALDKAAVIVALDSDFLSSGPQSVRLARQFAAKRRPEAGGQGMTRLYVVEPTPSATGVKADHRLALSGSQIELFTRDLAALVGTSVQTSVQSGSDHPASQTESAPYASWLQAVARDLLAHRGASVVIAGEHQPAAVHAWVHVINQALGNIGTTILYTDPVEAEPSSQIDSLRSLVDDMDSGKVEWLLIVGGNPVYDAPADLAFGDKLRKIPLCMHLSPYADETSALCHWHVPEAHYLEAWSDTRAFDGTGSIVQPVIAPLYEGKSAHELLAAFSTQPERSGYDIVRGYWQTRHQEKDFEAFWRQSLHDGIIAGTSLPTINVTAPNDWQPAAAKAGSANSTAALSNTYEIIFRPDPSLFDGRFANNGWLQELPKPITRLTWDNAALVSPATAERLGINYEVDSTGGEHGQVSVDVLEINVAGRAVQAPAWIVPGQDDHTITLHLGYGRTRSGHVGTGTGFNAYALRTAASPGSAMGASAQKNGQHFRLACVQFHHAMEGRDIIHAGTLQEYLVNPAVAPPPEKLFSLYPGYAYKDYAWGMTIDLNACVGCNACVVACQAENNIPIVGKPEVMRGREMHWIRIDHYHRGSLDSPDRYFQPVPCMQCENAPCELVCPVGATVHSAEGLNDMVYNRCVGTRYCSNNCPYKVRRFNFFQYSDWDTAALKLLHNPNVTVRSRGVMEKCTYCVQRINRGRIEAEKEGRPIRDGEILTACQQVCPAQAIVFGNINDPKSRVAQLKADPRNYQLLEELNTRPRTTYLAAVTNPSPNVPVADSDAGETHGN